MSRPSNWRRDILRGATVGLVLTVPLLSVMFLGMRLAGLTMSAYDIFEVISRIPQLGGIVTRGIDAMVSIFSRVPGDVTDQFGKASEQIVAIILFLMIGTVIGAIYALLRRQSTRTVGTVLGLVLWGVAAGALLIKGSDQLLLDTVWLLAVFVVWGYTLGWVYDTLYGSSSIATSTEGTTVNESRRKFLSQLGGSVLAITLGALGLGAIINRRASGSAGQPLALATSAANETLEQATLAATQNAEFIPVNGTRPEITANEDFYRVDVNVAGAPHIDENTWTLSIEGLVDNPFTLTYKTLRDMPPTEQYATLECISNPVGGDLISTTLWTGVKLRELLEKAGLKDGVVEIMFTCADGYTESLPLESAMDERSLLAYAMNHDALTGIHGFPLRLFTPNRYGMKNPKWITKIEAIATPYDGFWEVRGWTKEAFYKSTSVIDTVATNDTSNGITPVGGIAFSGDRGISKVELSIDDGVWQAAEIKAPVSPQTWHLWRFNWNGAPGKHQLRVRAYEGDGKPQIEQEADLHPDGASGYHSFEITL